MIRCFGVVHDDAEHQALREIADNFWLTAGPKAAQFERDFAAYLGVNHALLCNSGSSANLLALSALMSPKLGVDRLWPGDEVITTACAFATTVAPIVQLGLVPVFVDVELGSYVASAESIGAAISDKTKAVMMAHACGVPFDCDAVPPDIWLVEDNCDALGSIYRGQRTGGIGDIGTHSFFAAHHITMGEGGCVVTHDDHIARAVRSLCSWGRDCSCSPGQNNACGHRFDKQHGDLPLGYDHKYVFGEIGYNLKVTEMQAAIGLAQMRKLPGFIKRRKANHAHLLKRLRVYPELIMPAAPEHSDPSWFCFILTVADGARFTRDGLVSYLESRRIETRPLFAGNLRRHPAFQHVPCRVAGDLKNTEKILSDSLLVGVWPGLDIAHMDTIADAVGEYIEGLA